MVATKRIVLMGDGLSALMLAQPTGAPRLGEVGCDMEYGSMAIVW